MSKVKIAFVIQRFGLDVAGGAELHCRYICENLKEEFDLTVLTTCAKDYITWKNYFKSGDDILNGVKLKRFKVKKKRDPVKFGKKSNFIFTYKHKIEDELEWLELQGPCSLDLVNYIEKNQDFYDVYIFFSYRYYHSYHGIKAVKDKSFLVPTAEADPAIKLGIFSEVFNSVKGIIYNTPEERELIINNHKCEKTISDVVGVGINEINIQNINKDDKGLEIGSPYLLYIGRVDNNKGCDLLFDYFKYYKKKNIVDLKLVIAGKRIIEIPKDESIIYLGHVSEEEKYLLLKDAIALMMPSRYESLSMVLLEAWFLSKPVIVNEMCNVLYGQVTRANGGLFFRDYFEFSECVSALIKNKDLQNVLGLQGNKYYKANYSWEVIKEKYLKLIYGFINSKGN